MKKNRVHLANIPTPIEKLSYDYNIYVKRDDMTGSEISGNKVRKLEYLVYDALNEKADILITCGGIQSNHARATAVAAVKMGLKSHLFLACDDRVVKQGNVLIDELYGAQISILTHREFENVNEIMEEARLEYEKQGKKAYVIPLGASNAIGNFGYIEAFDEILKYEIDNKITFNTVVCTVGSGGTYAGLWLGNYLTNSGKNIVGINISQDAAYFKQVISVIANDTLKILGKDYNVKKEEINIIDGFVGRGYALSKPDEIEFIKNTVLNTGIVFDPVYTGKAFRGMIKTLDKNPELLVDDKSDNILFIHTGGFFSVFARANDLT